MTADELELQLLIEVQRITVGLVLSVDDAMFISETAGLMRDTEQDALSVLSDAGFDHETGVHTALSMQHEGAMLAAGYMMMECDE